MNIIEHIDNLLLEGVENLGFSSRLASKIEEVIPGNRKAQRYLAEIFKAWNFKNPETGETVFILADTGIRPFHIPIQLEDEGFDPGEFLNNLLRSLGEPVEDPDSSDMTDARAMALRVARLARTNIKSVSDIMTFRKKCIKAVEEMPDFRSTIFKNLPFILTTVEDMSFPEFKRAHSDLVYYLNIGSSSYEDLKGVRDGKKALVMAQELLGARPERKESKVLTELPGGYYWYELEGKRECEREGDRMSHCGYLSNERNIMYSLRDSNDKPHVTIEMTTARARPAIVQLKGKGNSVPLKYSRYIRDFVKHFNAVVLENWTQSDLSNEEKRKFLDEIT